MLELFGWFTLVALTMYFLVGGILLAGVDNTFSGKVEPICYIFVMIGLTLSAACWYTAPFTIELTR